MPALRVLLLEDDAALRLFVEMALEPLPVQLVPCATLAQARQALADAAVQLVMTDLALPDGSGLELLQWLAERARSTGVPCRTVVFSGGIDPAMEQQLQALQVWRVLHKPASVGSLMACVSDALAADAPPAQVAPPADPVRTFFDGNRSMYEAYRAASLAQFPKTWATAIWPCRRAMCRPCGTWPTTSSRRWRCWARSRQPGWHAPPKNTPPGLRQPPRRRAGNCWASRCVRSWRRAGRGAEAMAARRPAQNH